MDRDALLVNPDAIEVPLEQFEAGTGGAVGGWLIDALTREREAIYLAPAQP